MTLHIRNKITTFTKQSDQGLNQKYYNSPNMPALIQRNLLGVVFYHYEKYISNQ